MRTISSAALARIEQQYGEEPVNIVEIQWVPDGNRLPYADKEIENIPGRILEISALDFIIDASGGSDSTEISVVLSDVDGSLKDIMDHHDVHLQPAWVYQWFEGLDLDDKFLIFSGQVNSPITWNEGDRTFSFTIVSRIEDAELGFSIEEGRFQAYDRDLIGKAWPLKFGTTIDVPAIQLTDASTGVAILGSGFGIADYWLPYKAAQNPSCPLVFTGFGVVKSNQHIDGYDVVAGYEPDPSCEVQKCQAIKEAKFKYAEQIKYQFDSVPLIGANQIANGTIGLELNGAKITGVISGSRFYITSREHPKFAELGPATDAGLDAIIKQKKNEGVRLGCGNYGLDYTEPDPSRLGVRQSEIDWNRFNSIPEAGFVWIPAGTKIQGVGFPVKYISSLLPETVLKVSAYRTIDGVKSLVTVPTSMYSVTSEDFNSYQVSHITLGAALSSLGSGWEDDIYVSSISSVGPNTVDIMIWLIEKYTQLDYDTTSFNAVRTLVDNYPMNFPYLERKNILIALKELAFQARCALYIRDGVFYLKYLPLLADPVDTITEDDVDNNTLELTHTPTEKLITKLTASWHRSWAKTEPNRVILRHNVKKYGVQEQEYDFYAFNELDYVVKSATFWLIRGSKTWRKIKFQTPIQKLALETFDQITLNLPSVNENVIPALIEQADYDSEARAMQFSVWTPVLAGTTTVYDFAHPSDIDEELFWPTDEEWERGAAGAGDDAPGFSVIAPAGHPLALSSTGGSISNSSCPSLNSIQTDIFANSYFNNSRKRGCGNDNGENTPSDKNDTKKMTEVEDSTSPDSEVPPGSAYETRGETLARLGGRSYAQETRDIANRAAAEAKAAKQEASFANEAAGGTGSGSGSGKGEDGKGNLKNLPSKKDLKKSGKYSQSDPEDPTNTSDCLFTANVYIHEAIFVGGPNGGSDPGDTGFIGATVPIRTDEITFATCEEAQLFVKAILKAYEKRQAAQNIEIEEQLPVNATSICPIYNPPCAIWDGSLPIPIAYDGIPAPGSPPEDDGNFDYINGAASAIQNGEVSL